MSTTFYISLAVAIYATGEAIWAVGFSRRWRGEATKFLEDRFGPGRNDDEVAEDARQDAAKWWLGIATVAWILVAAVHRSGG